MSPTTMWPPLISQPTYSIIIIYLDDYITLTYIVHYIT